MKAFGMEFDVEFVFWLVIFAVPLPLLYKGLKGDEDEKREQDWTNFKEIIELVSKGPEHHGKNGTNAICYTSGFVNNPYRVLQLPFDTHIPQGFIFLCLFCLYYLVLAYVLLKFNKI